VGALRNFNVSTSRHIAHTTTLRHTQRDIDTLTMSSYVHKPFHKPVQARPSSSKLVQARPSPSKPLHKPLHTRPISLFTYPDSPTHPSTHPSMGPRQVHYGLKWIHKQCLAAVLFHSQVIWMSGRNFAGGFLTTRLIIENGGKCQVC
jgi:hypothetical protein